MKIINYTPENEKLKPQTKNVFPQVTKEGLDKCKLYHIHTLLRASGMVVLLQVVSFRSRSVTTKISVSFEWEEREI